ncbi:DUF2637 domain-containing protein [Streptomyces sp. NPDC049813]|uniref:DUF2637 domain-containing protein n=1 Tax=Streptomyces sp. NPDC049813 TaxID=3365597 RepID=UPI0037A6E126
MHETSGRHRRSQPFIPGPATGSPAAPGSGPQPQETFTHVGSLPSHWDPTQELAYLLGEAIDHETHQAADFVTDGAPTLVHATDVGPDEVLHPEDSLSGPGPEFGQDGPDGPLPGEPDPTAAEIATADLNRLQPPPPARRRRSRARPRRRATGAGLLRLTSVVIAAVAAVTVSAVCVFGGMVSYHPLRQLAVHRTTSYTVNAWPLLIYGPWIVASLSVLRAGLHRRRAAHSWAVVLLFSVVAMVLCVAQARHRPLDAAAAALPALAALACFQQLMRQITLSRPPRQSHPRHRGRRTATKPPPA